MLMQISLPAVLRASKSRAREFSLSRYWLWASYLLLASYLILIISTFRDYGINWDESWQATYGDYIIRWFSSLFHDRSAVDFGLGLYLGRPPGGMPYYGGFFETIAQILTRISPLGIFETRHLFNALFGALGAFVTFKIGSRLAGPLAGFLSTLFLILTPSFYGHAFNNSKDIPFLALYALSIYYLLIVVQELPHVSATSSIKLALAIGLTLGVRVSGMLLFGYLALAFGLWVLLQYVVNRSPQPSLRHALMILGRSFLFIAVIAWAIMIVWWPYAQTQPITHPLEALTVASHFPWSNLVFFDGRFTSAIYLPRYYLAKWLLIGLPEFYFIGLAVGMFWLISASSRLKGVFHSQHFIAYSLVLTAALFPVILASLGRVAFYDAFRHFLFVVPPLAVLAACSLVKLFREIKLRVLVAAVTLAVAVSAVMTGVDMVQLHPYEYIFFNRLFGGGLQQAAKSFETDYFGDSYKEGVEWIEANYKGASDSGKIKVASCSFPLSTSYFLSSDRFEYVGSYSFQVKDRPDVFLATTRWGCDQKLNGRVIHTVERQGTPILYIKEIADGT
jgi:hypothetical protein